MQVFMRLHKLFLKPQDLKFMVPVDCHTAQILYKAKTNLLTGDRSLSMFWWWGKLEYPQKTHTDTRKDMQTPHREALPQPGMESRTILLWGNSTKVWVTMQIITNVKLATNSFARMKFLFHLICVKAYLLIQKTRAWDASLDGHGYWNVI